MSLALSVDAEECVVPSRLHIDDAMDDNGEDGDDADGDDEEDHDYEVADNNDDAVCVVAPGSSDIAGAWSLPQSDGGTTISSH